MSIETILNKIAAITDGGNNSALEVRAVLTDITTTLSGATILVTNITSDEYILELTDTIVRLGNNTGVTLSIPLEDSVNFSLGTEIIIFYYGTGTATIDGGLNTLKQDVGGLTMTGGAKRTLTKIHSNYWVVSY
jgi:hypothetical protein